MSATGTGLDDHCTSSGDATLNVPRQTVAAPRGGINDADFGVTFMLIGSDKNTYGLSVGDIQPEFSDVKATVIVTCPEGTSHTHEFPYTDPDRDVRALVARGRVGASSLTASAHTRNSFCGLDAVRKEVGWASFSQGKGCPAGGSEEDRRRPTLQGGC